MAEIINNYLSPTNFTISIQRIPNIEFFVQKMSIPSLSATAPARDTPLSTLYDINDKLIYSDLEMTFIVDENMNNYKEIFDWMEGLSGSQTPTQTQKLALSEYGFKSDIKLTENINLYIVVQLKNIYNEKHTITYYPVFSFRLFKR